MNRLALRVLVSLLLGVMARPSCALNQPSHEVVNEQAVIASSLDDVLKQRLALSNGIRESFKGKEAFRWVREGGAREDDGSEWDMIRSLRKIT